MNGLLNLGGDTSQFGLVAGHTGMPPAVLARMLGILMHYQMVYVDSDSTAEINAHP